MNINFFCFALIHCIRIFKSFSALEKVGSIMPLNYSKCCQRSIQSIGPLKALYTSPPCGPIHSGTNSTSLRSILATQQLRAKTKSLTFPHLSDSIARYSFIQLSGLGHRGENENAQTLKQHQKGIEAQTPLIQFY